ncbi:MAG: mRNA cap guanine-N7 methyltransferase [archaeon]|nr:mRNA cap guanine-N7 methyltransferase [archaeon]
MEKENHSEDKSKDLSDINQNTPYMEQEDKSEHFFQVKTEEPKGINFFRVDTTASSNKRVSYQVLPEPEPNRTQGGNIINQSKVSNFNPDSKSKMISHDYYYKNALRDPGKEGRQASRLIFLREFNNWIKAVLINKSCNMLGKSNLSVFDICCGRGGDLKKFFFNKIKIYVGADLSPESLLNAMDRIKRINAEISSNGHKTKCILVCEDVSSDKNKLMTKIDKLIKFDLVSCQFALHYHFHSKDRIHTFFKNVVERLCDGGLFICTIIDDKVLIKRLRENESRNTSGDPNEALRLGNKFYSIKFNQSTFRKKDGPFGIKYGFFLEDSIGSGSLETGDFSYVGEFLIVFDELVKVAEEYDLHLVERLNFTEFYKKYNEDSNDFQYKKMFSKMIRNLNDPFKKEQWDIADLYQAVTFRKGEENEEIKLGEKRQKRSYTSYLDSIDNEELFKDYEPVLINQSFE